MAGKKGKKPGVGVHYRKARMGSVRAACQAGTKQATMEIATITTAAITNAIGGSGG